MTMFLRQTPGRTALHNADFCSVAIVSFNRFDLLHKVIDSIHKYADMPFEVVLSDDGGFLYNDLGIFNQFKDKVSRICINTGNNMGLAVNANMAVGMTRSKYVALFYDDCIVTRPFMRQAQRVVDAAPYVGAIYLGTGFSYDPSEEAKKIAMNSGMIHAKTVSGDHINLFCLHGSSQGTFFKKDYWYEVGGYSEDDIYGDLPFLNKGWLRGRFSAALDGGPSCYDIDREELGGEHSSVPQIANGSMCNYPKLFKKTEQEQVNESRVRSKECGMRNHNGRAEQFNEYDCHSWREYVKSSMAGGTVNWDVLSLHHSRYMDILKRDVLF